MSILFWLLVIPGAIITYLIFGFFLVLLLHIITCVKDWKKDFNDDITIPMILCWPLTLILALIYLPIAIMKSIIEKITEG